MTYVSLSTRCLRLKLSGSLGLIRSLASLTQREISGFPVERVGRNAAAHVDILRHAK